MSQTHDSQKRYPPELKERAVRMVQETIALEGRSLGVITRVARQLGIGSESLPSGSSTLAGFSALGFCVSPLAAIVPLPA